MARHKQQACTTAAWRHYGARTGFEVAFLQPHSEGVRIHGCTTAIEAGLAWSVEYSISVDRSWTTREARTIHRSVHGSRRILLEATGAGSWRVDGRGEPRLDGCLDVDLESSALTNALPVLRLGLAVGVGSSAPAAYVRALEPAVDRLEQHYARLGDQGGHLRYNYSAPAFGFSACLTYDAAGLVLDYPGIAVRAG